MKAVVFLLGVMFAVNSWCAVWQDTNQWNAQWERRYEQWVQQQWTFDVFVRPGSLYEGLATDCADATYSMRALFAYLHKLPFVVNDPGAYGRTISNKTSRYDHLGSSRARLMAFSNAIHMVLSTKSLPQDTYPVAVNRRGFAAGGLYASPGTHAYQISGQNEYGILQVLSSTVPRQVRALHQEDGFPQYVPEDFKGYKDGYRRFKQPHQLKMNSLSVPGASIEQFHIAKTHNAHFMSFTDALTAKLQIRPEPIETKANRMMINICSAVGARSSVVQGAVYYSQSIGGRCMNAREYDDYSTPSRDKRLKASFEYLKTIRSRPIWNTGGNFINKNAIELLFSGNRHLNAWQKEQVFLMCNMTYADHESTRIDLYDVWWAIKDRRLSTDPNVDIHSRWGKGSQLHSGCPTY